MQRLLPINFLFVAFESFFLIYWQSWNEIGILDLPAIIDFILDKTQQNQLIAAGHSQGGSAIAVLLSERPEYNQKISSVHLMAGAIFLKYYNQALEPFLKHLNEIKVGGRGNAVKKMEEFRRKKYRSGFSGCYRIYSFISSSMGKLWG